MTKLLGVIGDPIAHSLSPLIHNGWLRDLGINASYEAMHVREGAFTTALKTLESRNILGVNVTLPHKRVALDCASRVSERAGKIGAANTLTFEGQGGWLADNTDAPGFLNAIGELNQYTDKVVILGAGGSARALVYALSERGISPTILNRTASKAEALSIQLTAGTSVYGGIDRYREHIETATIVVNTTSRGHSGDIFDLPNGAGRLFFDISYGEVSAAQLSHAADRGWRVLDGLGMLVAQAAFSFEIWFGEFPDLEAGLERCRRAVRATL